ncbi:MAG TPA: FAD-dependent thymidylate synthase [Elusimicrobiales bacterium]|nr:FAD-dependent thymidylate synthase [Elusimicrobiales bacterium]
MDNVVKNKENAIKILDKGFMRLVNYTGGDQMVVDSARVSFGSSSKDEKRNKLLIHYLLENSHMSPFEHSVFQLHVKCPIFVARQWMRHRWCSYNEVSARYTEVSDEFYIPEKFRTQDKTNIQGSIESDKLDHEKLLKDYSECINNSMKCYRELLDAGVAREMARMVLPVSQYTQFYWTVNSRSLMNFISLRLDVHAQKEIRAYADAASKIFADVMPWTWDAFNEIYIKNKKGLKSF